MSVIYIVQMIQLCAWVTLIDMWVGILMNFMDLCRLLCRLEEF